MPSRYRQVTVAEVDDLDPDALCDHFTDREAYLRTRFVVARHGGDHALVELVRDGSDALFSRTVRARMLAGVDECVWVSDPKVDCGLASHLARVADEHPGARCVIVHGRYEHVSFLLNPRPIEIEVLDIVPPLPSKLVDQVQRVLDVDEGLPPIVLRPRVVDSRQLLADEGPGSAHVLVPCRGGGVEVDGVEVSYLDERPAGRDWALLGCQRSQQIHRWFYGVPAAEQVDSCPRRFLEPLEAGGTARISRCCLLESGLEHAGQTVMVPWGASLAEVRDAIARITADGGVPWTRT